MMCGGARGTVDRAPRGLSVGTRPGGAGDARAGVKTDREEAGSKPGSERLPWRLAVVVIAAISIGLWGLILAGIWGVFAWVSAH